MASKTETAEFSVPAESSSAKRVEEEADARTISPEVDEQIDDESVSPKMVIFKPCDEAEAASMELTKLMAAAQTNMVDSNVSVAAYGIDSVSRAKKPESSGGKERGMPTAIPDFSKQAQYLESSVFPTAAASARPPIVRMTRDESTGSVVIDTSPLPGPSAPSQATNQATNNRIIVPPGARVALVSDTAFVAVINTPVIQQASPAALQPLPSGSKYLPRIAPRPSHKVKTMSSLLSDAKKAKKTNPRHIKQMLKDQAISSRTSSVPDYKEEDLLQRVLDPAQSGFFCCVETCRNNQLSIDPRTELPVKLHPFPPNGEVNRLRIWIQRVRQKDVNPDTVKNKFICSAHFEQKLYDGSASVNYPRLVRNALPTLGLPESPSKMAAVYHHFQEGSPRRSSRSPKKSESSPKRGGSFSPRQGTRKRQQFEDRSQKQRANQSQGKAKSRKHSASGTAKQSVRYHSKESNFPRNMAAGGSRAKEALRRSKPPLSETGEIEFGPGGRSTGSAFSHQTQQDRISNKYFVQGENSPKASTSRSSVEGTSNCLEQGNKRSATLQKLRQTVLQRKKQSPKESTASHHPEPTSSSSPAYSPSTSAEKSSNPDEDNERPLEKAEEEIEYFEDPNKQEEIHEDEKAEEEIEYFEDPNKQEEIHEDEKAEEEIEYFEHPNEQEEIHVDDEDFLNDVVKLTSSEKFMEGSDFFTMVEQMGLVNEDTDFLDL